MSHGVPLRIDCWSGYFPVLHSESIPVHGNCKCFSFGENRTSNLSTSLSFTGKISALDCPTIEPNIRSVRGPLGASPV
jgi:hypothetical protein